MKGPCPSTATPKEDRALPVMPSLRLDCTMGKDNYKTVIPGQLAEPMYVIMQYMFQDQADLLYPNGKIFFAPHGTLKAVLYDEPTPEAHFPETEYYVALTYLMNQNVTLRKFLKTANVVPFTPRIKS